MEEARSNRKKKKMREEGETSKEISEKYGRRGSEGKGEGRKARKYGRGRVCKGKKERAEKEKLGG